MFLYSRAHISSLLTIFALSLLSYSNEYGPIHCNGEFPPTPWGSPSFNFGLNEFPLTEADFPSGLNQFCSRDSHAPNVGAYCDHNKVPAEVNIDYTMMDLRVLNTATARWCRRWCTCDLKNDDHHMLHQIVELSLPKNSFSELGLAAKRQKKSSPRYNTQAGRETMSGNSLRKEQLRVQCAWHESNESGGALPRRPLPFCAKFETP